MEAIAKARYVRQSPRKMRIVVDEVRGKNVGLALNYLHFSPLKASYIIEKALRSAVANFMQKTEGSNVDPENLKIKEIFVNGGPVMKRFRAASMGRASRLHKPSCHLNIVVTDEGK
ncbi:MAG: 50S ribosomal protein L22 [Candidatus Neomarinimicrobiota bacterium]